MSDIGNKEVFAKNLSRYLERCPKSQREIAEIVGVSPSTFSEWVNARKYPRIDKIEILANYFGILKSDLIEDKENDPHPKKETPSAEADEIQRLLSKLSDEKKDQLIQYALFLLSQQDK